MHHSFWFNHSTILQNFIIISLEACRYSTEIHVLTPDCCNATQGQQKHCFAEKFCHISITVDLLSQKMNSLQSVCFISKNIPMCMRWQWPFSLENMKFFRMMPRTNTYFVYRGSPDITVSIKAVVNLQFAVNIWDSPVEQIFCWIFHLALILSFWSNTKSWFIFLHSCRILLETFSICLI